MYGGTLHQYPTYSADDQKTLWEATNPGPIQVIATDEVCRE